MSENDQEKDAVTAFNEKTKKYGAGYAVFSDALGGDNLRMTVKVVQVCLVLAAVFVVGASIWARVGG